MKRNLNNVSEVELNLMGTRCIGKSIERFLCFGFEIFDNTDDLVNSGLIDQTARAIDEQANIWVIFNFRWELIHYELLSFSLELSRCYCAFSSSLLGTPMNFFSSLLMRTTTRAERRATSLRRRDP